MRVSEFTPKQSKMISFLPLSSIAQNLSKSDVTFFSFFQIKGTTSYGFHTIMNEEQMSFARWLNRHLGDIAELSHLLPLADDGDDLYTKIGDGILLW